ncbi:L,D-transpeptidase family protein [Streptomyces sp. NPDC006193]|uniref:L,D-transpeptidase family protein n=1 Tax=Streptomyces sp. NPDC006193 TaxID=3155717 RepID=UPI0033A3B2EB
MRRAAVAVVAFGTLLGTLSACGGAGPARTREHQGAHGEPGRTHAPSSVPTARFTRIPGVGDRLYRRIPADSRQIVAVYGKGEDSADAEVVLYTRRGATWRQVDSWPAHNGRRGWTEHHHEGDKRSPVGVFTLTDAGGVLADPATRLSYDRDTVAYAAPAAWPKAYQHDFDYVIAIDYNRRRGTPPRDATRPLGQEKGGGIWLHMDHGSGTSACVSVSRSAMKTLLRTLDPARHPVVVMGDRAHLLR